MQRAAVWENKDGRRIEDGRYAAFSQAISDFIPKERQFTDPVRTFAYGTDASFYRLNPKMVVKVHTEEEVRRILPIAARMQVPVTFRAAGTSLSGQAITDSVLLKLSHTGKNFRNYTIHVSFLPGCPAVRPCSRVCRRCFAPFTVPALLLLHSRSLLPVTSSTKHTLSMSAPRMTHPTQYIPICDLHFRRVTAARLQWSRGSLAARSTASWRRTRRSTTTLCSTRSGLTPRPSTPAWCVVVSLSSVPSYSLFLLRELRVLGSSDPGMKMGACPCRSAFAAASAVDLVPCPISVSCNPQVGGMVSNNSSGMCCGVSQNTYHTLRDMRIVFADGTMMDTADPDSRAAFLEVRSPTMLINFPF